MQPTDLEALAARVEAAGDITCPFCGEDGFDIPGFVFSHEDHCEVRSAALSSMPKRNSDIAAALRAKASHHD